MKTSSFTAFFVTGLIWIAPYAWGKPVDLSAPSGGVGASNSRGYLEIWRDIDGVGLQLDKDSYLPLRYKFSSEPNTGGMLGTGFYCPMFEAKNVLIRENTMRAYLPCGKVLYFWRTNGDPNKFLTVDKEWSGYLQGDDFTVWRDDGWKLLYQKSRLASLTTDDNHTFAWSYTDGGMPTGVTKDGQSAITVEPNAAGQVAAFVFDSKRYEVTYADRPITQVLLGQIALKELDQTLSSFKYPDGRMETYKFALTPDRVPTLTFTDLDQKQTDYTWDGASNYIATEQGPQGNWTYKVGAVAEEFGLPPISRTNGDGKTESIAVDTKTGIYTVQGADGVTTITHIFNAPGPLYRKVHEIDRVQKVDGKDVTTQVYRASYDETGKLIRKIDEKGFMTTFTYDGTGQIIKRVVNPPTDPASVLAFKNQEEQLLKQIANTTSPTDRSDLMQQLATFYIGRRKDISKALALLPQISDVWDASEVQIMCICGNDDLTPLQKSEQLKALISTYPTRKEELNNLSSHYQNTAY